MYDAIIIHIRGLPNDWPSKRSQEQRYIMLSIDAPIKLYEYRHLEKLAFNWTMTYRLDSDFPVPYAWIDRVLPLPAPQGSTLLQRFIASHGKKAVTQGPNLAENKVYFFQTPRCLKITEKRCHFRTLPTKLSKFQKWSIWRVFEKLKACG